MQMNCDTANKLVKKLSAERTKVLSAESTSSTFGYLQGEEPYKPEYDFAATQAALAALDNKIITLKHAVNLFNISHMVPGTNLTVDAALVRMTFLSSEKERLNRMRQVPKKRRSVSIGGKTSEFTERNYDDADAEAAYQAALSELTTIQQGLNAINMTEFFEVELDM